VSGRNLRMNLYLSCRCGAHQVLVVEPANAAVAAEASGWKLPTLAEEAVGVRPICPACFRKSPESAFLEMRELCATEIAKLLGLTEAVFDAELKRGRRTQ
jgi:hypothetical protein